MLCIVKIWCSSREWGVRNEKKLSWKFVNQKKLQQMNKEAKNVLCLFFFLLYQRKKKFFVKLLMGVIRFQENSQ